MPTLNVPISSTYFMYKPGIDHVSYVCLFVCLFGPLKSRVLDLMSVFHDSTEAVLMFFSYF